MFEAAIFYVFGAIMIASALAVITHSADAIMIAPNT